MAVRQQRLCLEEAYESKEAQPSASVLSSCTSLSACVRFTHLWEPKFNLETVMKEKRHTHDSMIQTNIPRWITHIQTDNSSALDCYRIWR